MKHPFTNLFTAPDAADILSERRLTLRNAILLAGTGIVLVSTLLGGYTLGTWFLVKATLPTVNEEVADTTIEKVLPEAPTLEERQAMLAKTSAESASQETRMEVGAFTEATRSEPTLEDRQRALDALKVAP